MAVAISKGYFTVEAKLFARGRVVKTADRLKRNADKTRYTSKEAAEKALSSIPGTDRDLYEVCDCGALAI